MSFQETALIALYDYCLVSRRTMLSQKHALFKREGDC